MKYKQSKRYLEYINKSIAKQWKIMKLGETLPYQPYLSWDTVPPGVAANWYPSYCVNVLKHKPKLNKISTWESIWKGKQSERRILNP